MSRKAIEDIRQWLEEGQRIGATHVILICDGETFEDSPLFVMSGRSCGATVDEYEDSVLEVYDLSMSWGIQLDERQAYHVTS